MKFLVVGASGFVGSNVLRHVKQQGFEAIGTQSRPRDPNLVTFNLLEHRISDVVSSDFFAGSEPKYVILSAVISNMDLCLTDRPMARKVNVEKTIQLVRDCQEREVTPVFLSSCFVFDGTVGYYNEDHPLSPVNEYGRHKAEVEKFLMENVPNSFIARLDKIVGDDPTQQQLFSYWYQKTQEGQPIVCLEGSLLSPTFVADVAKAIVLACEKNLHGIHHVSNAEFFYRDELARQFCYALQRQPSVITRRVEEFNFPDKRALKSYLDGSRFRNVSGLSFTSMREVFRRFRQNAT